MKVKELIKILKQQDQEAEIRVSGGFVEYSTKDVLVTKINDDICIYEKN